MRIVARSVLCSDEQRDDFHAFLRKWKVQGSPKRVDDNGMSWIEFLIPRKWKLHEAKQFVEELDSKYGA
jgi:hypothetical protein